MSQNVVKQQYILMYAYSLAPNIMVEGNIGNLE